MRFKIEWASLLFGSIFTVFALFYFVFEGNFPSKSLRGAYIWRGNLTEGFFALPVWGAYIWRGLFSEFTVCFFPLLPLEVAIFLIRLHVVLQISQDLKIILQMQSKGTTDFEVLQFLHVKPLPPGSLALCFPQLHSRCCHNHTAILRKVVGKNVHATMTKGNLGYDQYTVPDLSLIHI